MAIWIGADKFSTGRLQPATHKKFNSLGSSLIGAFRAVVVGVYSPRVGAT